GGVAEERGRVVHEGVEAAHTGERGVQCGLIAGGEGVGRVGGEGPEVAAESTDAAERASTGPELNNWERVGRVLREVAVVCVGDDVAGEIALMEPAGKGEYAALRATKLHNLGDENGAGAGSGRGVGHGQRRARASREVKNSGKEMAAASAPRISVLPVARRAAMANAMAMRWSEPESIAAPWRAWLPGISRPSGFSVKRAPMARRFLATRAMRSDSLTRSSWASRIIMPQDVNGA